MPSEIMFYSLSLGSSSSLASLRNQQRVNLFGNRPFRVLLTPEQSVDEPDRSPVRACPSTFENTRVMKNHDASGLHKRTPVIPITLDGGFRMVPVDQDQIDSRIPTTGRFLAEFLDPDNISSAAGAVRASGR